MLQERNELSIYKEVSDIRILLPESVSCSNTEQAAETGALYSTGIPVAGLLPKPPPAHLGTWLSDRPVLKSF